MLDLDKNIILIKYKDYLRNKYKSFSLKYIKVFIDYINNNFTNIDPDLYFKDLLKNNKELITNYFNYIKELSISNNVKNLLISSLRNFYSFLYSNHYLDEETLKYSYEIKKFKREKKKYYITLTELNYLIRKATLFLEDLNVFKLKALLYLIYFSAISSKDLFILKRENFDFNHSKIVLNQKIIYYPKKLNKLLVRYFNSEEEINNAFNLSERNRRILLGVLGRYKIKNQKVDFKYLRECAIYYLSKKIKNPFVIKELIGFKSVDTAKKYMTFTNEELEKIYHKKINLPK